MATSVPPRRLSSGTLLYKKGFPWLWAGGVVAVAANIAWRLADGEPSPFHPWPYLVVCLVGGAITLMVASQLVDEVIDGGDHLLVRVGNQEERVLFTQIAAVRESLFMRQPHRIELVLTHPGKFGGVITFIPSGFLPVPLFRTELFHELRRRTAAAQREPAR